MPQNILEEYFVHCETFSVNPGCLSAFYKNSGIEICGENE